MKNFKQCCAEVAIKNKLGNNLVTGHRFAYYEEAAIEFAKQVVDECLISAKIKWVTDITAADYQEIDKDSILSVKEKIY